MTATAHTLTVTPASGTNYAAPGAITTSGLTTSMSGTTFLGLASETGPNGDAVSFGYDAFARPTSSTSPHGAVTGISYSTSAPWTKTVGVNSRWTRYSLDGLGRTVRAETGTGTTVSSVVDSEYAPCACSPLGKVWRVSQPHQPGGTVYWTTYSYDALGRTVSVAHAGGTGTTTYVYEGNTVKVTDPAGKWKKYTMNAMGNLTQVTEPDPAAGPDHQTYYTYNVLNQVTQVQMPRGGYTQTRTFNYNLGTGRLTSATNPENGTVSYTYNGDGTVATKTDAKNQRIEYAYL